MYSSQDNPPSRFEPTHVEWEGPAPEVQYTAIEDHSRSILSENRSPDLPFRWSLNPYRGCFHGCAYCYARPSHEYLGYGAGTDFQTRLLYKPGAANLLTEAFEKPSWRGELVLMSGNTDCYQPLEIRLGLTRACLEVCRDYRNPVGILTRSTAIRRDVDLLAELHERAWAGVTFSIPFLDPVLCRKIEPGAPPPAQRLAAMKALAEVGIPVGVNVAPLIPGLNDTEMVSVLQAAKEAGASWCSTILLRLPGPVAPWFESQVRAAFPDRADSIMARIRRARGGALNQSGFGARMRGTGPEWEATMQLFRLTRTRLGFGEPPRPAKGTFRRPGRGVQGELFSRPDQPR